MRVPEFFIDLIFPLRCVVCDDVVPSHRALCDLCERNIDYLTVETKCCDRCGKRMIDCICRYAAFSFSGCVSAMTYNDNSKSIIHALKYQPDSPISEYLAKVMVRAQKERFGDINFDYVTEVPMKKEEITKRGHNQAQTLAIAVGSLANIPYLESPIIQTHHMQTQHKLSAFDRYENVKNSFVLSEDASIFGSVLLVDDVVTTGATLNRCASLLISCGAREVFCLTAATTPIR